MLLGRARSAIIAGGTASQLQLGVETGNVVYDGQRRQFWITVVRKSLPDQLVAIDPISSAVSAQIDLPGCQRAHGLRLHPDGRSAVMLAGSLPSCGGL